MDYAQIIGAFVAAFGFLIGEGKEAEAQALRAKIAAQFGPEILPQLDEAVATHVGQSAFESTFENPDARARQVSIDDELSNIYDTAGQTDEDQAAYNVARRNVASQSKSRAASNAQQLAARGQAGSPLAAVLAAQAAQDETNALGAMDDNIASDSRGRALQALNMRASNASDIRRQDWNALGAKASAMDIQNRFNAANDQQANMYNAGLPQQRYENELRRRAAQGNAYNGMALGLEGSADRTRAAFGGTATAISQYRPPKEEKDPNDYYDKNDFEKEY